MVDHNNPSDEQWWALLKFVKADPELLSCQYTKKGAQGRVSEQWEKAAVILNALKKGNLGCSKSGESWRNSWNGLKARARKAAQDKNRKKRNSLFEAVFALVGPVSTLGSTTGEACCNVEMPGQAEQVPPQQIMGPVAEAGIHQDFMWADLDDPASGVAGIPNAVAVPYPAVKVEPKTEVEDDGTDEVEPPLITIEDTPDKFLLDKNKKLHTPPSGCGAIPKRRLKYYEDIDEIETVVQRQNLGSDEAELQAEETQNIVSEPELLTKAIEENTAMMLRLIKKLDSVSLLPL